MGCCYGRKKPFYPGSTANIERASADSASKDQYIAYSPPFSKSSVLNRNGFHSRGVDWDEVYDSLRQSEDSEDSIKTTISAPADLS